MSDESDRVRIRRTLDALEDEALGELYGLSEAELSARGVEIARELGIDLDELAKRIRARIARREEG